MCGSVLSHCVASLGVEAAARPPQQTEAQPEPRSRRPVYRAHAEQGGGLPVRTGTRGVFSGCGFVSVRFLSLRAPPCPSCRGWHCVSGDLTGTVLLPSSLPSASWCVYVDVCSHRASFRPHNLHLNPQPVELRPNRAVSVCVFSG